MNKPRILIFGTVASELSFGLYEGCNVPMAKWLSPLAQALENHSTVRLLSHAYERVWPYGRLIPGGKSYFAPNLEYREVSYFNVPYLRLPLLKLAYLQAIKKEISERGHPDFVITYNCYDWYADALKFVLNNASAKWVPILLDPDPGKGTDQIKHFTECIQSSAGVVALSWHLFERLGSKKKMHLDSGLNSIAAFSPHNREMQTNNRRIVLYSGKLEDTFGGLNVLAAAIHKIADQNVDFLFVGRGRSKSLEALASSDRRVQLLGFVSESELDNLCKRATVFVNPRSPRHPDNAFIFPSKILFYLSYGKPVISFRTLGLSPEYDEVLDLVDEPNADALASKVTQVLGEGSEKAYNRWEAQKHFAATKTWAMQAKRLSEFLNNLN